MLHRGILFFVGFRSQICEKFAGSFICRRIENCDSVCFMILRMPYSMLKFRDKADFK